MRETYDEQAGVMNTTSDLFSLLPAWVEGLELLEHIAEPNSQ